MLKPRGTSVENPLCFTSVVMAAQRARAVESIACRDRRNASARSKCSTETVRNIFPKDFIRWLEVCALFLGFSVVTAEEVSRRWKRRREQRERGNFIRESVMCNKGVLIWTVVVKRANSCGRHCHPRPDLYRRYLPHSSNYKFPWSVFFFQPPTPPSSPPPNPSTPLLSPRRIFALSARPSLGHVDFNVWRKW